MAASAISMTAIAVPVASALASTHKSEFFMAAQMTSSQNLLNGKLFGNIPNVTVRGVAAGGAPWVVNGSVMLTRSKLVASGKWLIVPKTGYLANGKPIPSKIAGTTVGATSVGAEITFANSPSIVVKAVSLSKQGDFSIDSPVTVPTGASDPVVLIGPIVNGKMKAWFASSNFLMDYGMYSSSGTAMQGSSSSSMSWSSKSGSGKPMSIDANGQKVQSVAGYTKIDPSTNKPITYMPIWYVMQVLKKLGFNSSWNGTSWDISNQSSGNSSSNSTANSTATSNAVAG